MRRSAAIILAICFSAGAGCGNPRIGGRTTPEKQLNQLRAQNHELRAQLEQVERELAARAAQLEAIEQQDPQRNARSSATAPDAQPPRLTSVKIDRLSGIRDAAGDGQGKVLRLYVKTLDQHNRQLPVAGTARISLYAKPDDREPVLLAEQSFDPQAVRDAYRSGLTGAHFTFTVPLDGPLPDGVQQATARITITDAGTGAKLSAERLIRLTPRER